MATKQRRSRKTRSRRKATVRRAPRRAPARQRRSSPARRRRRNPKGIMDQPAVKYGLTAAGGALLAGIVNAPPKAGEESMFSALDGLTFKDENGVPKLKRSTPAAIITGGIGWFFSKGKTRAFLLAAAAGMMVPQFSQWLTDAMTDDDTTTSSAASEFRIAAARTRRPARIARKRSPATTKLHNLNKNIISA